MPTGPIDETTLLEDILPELDAPTTAPETLDVRALGPPKPLTETLERLGDLPEDGVLVQYNDRVPQHLYPRLEERGFAYETVERGDVVVTAIWRTE